jgi:hypothetical protein
MNLCKNCGIDGLSAVNIRGMGNMVCADWSTLADCYDDGTGLATSLPSTTNVSTTTIPPSVITSIANTFSSIFKTIQPLPAGCTVVAGPYGQSTACSGTGTNPLSLTSSLSSLTGSSSTMLLLGGAVLLIMLMKK